MFVVRRGNEWLAQHQTGGYYWTGPGLSGWRVWAWKFNTREDAVKASKVYGGDVEKFEDE